MQLSFIYQPVTDLAEAVAFHRDVLGLDEAWRESDDTVAFALPDSPVQVMISTDPGPVGPMYLVNDLSAWMGEHPDLEIVVPHYEIPGGAMVGYTGPGGNAFYVFDQPDA